MSTSTSARRLANGSSINWIQDWVCKMKLNEIKKLNDTELRIKVAENHEWETLTSKHGTAFFKDGRAYPALDVPDYPSDLNACKLFEDSMNEYELNEYLYALGKVIYGLMSNRNDWRFNDMAIASARRRCEAFLFVMTNLRITK
jgi:hypothetical protein